MDLKEEKIYIRGIGINYLKIGTGEHPVLLLPGTLGSIWKTFKPQIENLDRNRFTLVVWDPPGYGNSRPAPTRKFSDGFLQLDATYAYELMMALGYKTFSMIGRSIGGTTACVLASMYPDSVRKMIIINARARILPEELPVYKDMIDLDNWSKPIATFMIDLYGEDYFRNVWSAWVDALTDLCKNRNGNICMEVLDKIQCPTLIVHGDGDHCLKDSHVVELKEKIRHSSVRIFKEGAHGPHLKYPKEFNDLAENFLSNPSNDEF